MGYRRRFRLDGVLYLIMLALMTPGILLSLGTSFFWRFLDQETTLWKTALGTNVVWGLPFAFLIMVAVWNRYDSTVEEASRDLGASGFRTFREVTLPLVWTGLLGAFLFGFTLAWNEYDRTALLAAGDNTLPLEIFALTVGSVIRPDLYALGTATTAVSLIGVGLFLLAAAIVLRRRARSSRRGRSTATKRPTGPAPFQPALRSRAPARRRDGRGRLDRRDDRDAPDPETGQARPRGQRRGAREHAALAGGAAPRAGRVRPCAELRHAR